MKPSTIFTFFLVLIGLSQGALASSATPKDSIGIEKKGNKILILHRVEPGQTLSSIARQYRTTLTDMKAENPEVQALQPGQVVKVPYVAPPSGAVAGNAPAPPASTPGFHTVAVGESLFGIARTHQVTVADLQKWNGLTDNNIKVGDQLAVTAAAAQTKASSRPADTTAASAVGTPAQAATPSTETASGRKTHTVAPGQTLNAVSRLYKVTLNELRQWNNLSSDNLTVGQELIVAGNPSVAATYNTEESSATEEPVAKVAKEVEPEKTVAPKTEEPAPRAAPKEEAKSPEMTGGKVVPPAGGYQKTTETGLAELIDGTQNNEKYLALHRTAPVGTIIQVKNLMNDLSVFVKVIGRLPDTGANDKLVVKISNKAYERLAAVDKKFRVEISYIP